jgi:hypothetical protein
VASVPELLFDIADAVVVIVGNIDRAGTVHGDAEWKVELY